MPLEGCKYSGERIGLGKCSNQRSASLQVSNVWTWWWAARNVLPVFRQLCQLTADYITGDNLHTTARSDVKHLTSRNLRKRLGFVCETNSVQIRPAKFLRVEKKGLAANRPSLTIIPNYLQITKSVERTVTELVKRIPTLYGNWSFDKGFATASHWNLFWNLLIVSFLCNSCLSITKTSEKGPFNIQFTSLNYENIHFKGLWIPTAIYPYVLKVKVCTYYWILVPSGRYWK